ncbi:MAG: hypothetical protein ACR2NL_05090 [Acidimicrobiia bacterium]
MQALRNVIDFIVRREWVAFLATLSVVLTEVADELELADVDGATPQQIITTVALAFLARGWKGSPVGVYSKRTYALKESAVRNGEA